MGPGSTFGQLLKRHRGAAELTQEELAEAAHVSVRGIQALESGGSQSPRPDTVALLSSALALTPQEQAAFAAAARSAAAPDRVPSEGRRAPAAGHPLVPLIGRAPEVALLERQLAGGLPSDEAPRLLLLAGEPGIGKSRLLQEAVQRGVAHGFTVLSGGCHRRGGQDPYAPLLDALLEQIHGQSSARARAALAGCAWLVQLLPELADLLEPVPAGPLDPRQERRLMFAAVARYLANVAGPAGTLLVLDDLQWAGPDALDLLDALLRSAAPGGGASRGPRPGPLRVVAAYRDTEVRPADPLGLLAADLTLAGLAHLHPLRPLVATDAATLLDHLLGGTAAAERAVATDVLERAGGVPFFLVSYARARQDGGAEETVPADLAQSLRQRVALLPAVGADILAATAIVGRRMPHALLVTVVQLPEEAVLAGVDAACQAGLLREESDAAYVTTHDVIREVVETDLGAARRALLHRKVATALDDGPGGTAPEVLAHHYARGGVPHKAVLYLEQAGDHAWAQRAHGAAEDHYRAALEGLQGLGHGPEALRVREKLGEVLGRIGRYGAALQVLEPAGETYRAADDWGGLGRVAAHLAELDAQRGAPEEGITRLQPVLEQLESRGASAPPAALYLWGGTLLLRLSRYGEALAALARADARAHASGDQRTLVLVGCARADILQRRGQIGAALRASRAVLPQAEALGEPELLATLHRDLAVLYVLRGDLVSGQRHLARTCALTEQLESPAIRSFNLALCGWLAIVSGDWPRARADLLQAVALNRQADRSVVAPYPLLFWARLSLVVGERATAAAAAQEAIGLAAANGDVQALRWASGTMAELDLLEGRPAAALARLVPLLDLPGLEESDVTALLPLLAWAQLELGHLDEAADVVAQALRRARAEELRLALVEALRVQALIALRRECWAEAAGCLEEGLALAQAMPSPYAEARLRQVEAGLRTRRGAAEHAGRAPEQAATACALAAPQRPPPGTPGAGGGTPPGAPGEAMPVPRRGSPEERAAWVLSYVRTVGAISPGLYGATLGVDRRTAQRDLQALEARGLIVAQGTTKDRRYARRPAQP